MDERFEAARDAADRALMDLLELGETPERRAVIADARDALLAGLRALEEAP